MLWTVTVAPGLTDAGTVNVKSLIMITASDPPDDPDPAAGAAVPDDAVPDDAPADEPEQPVRAARTASAIAHSNAAPVRRDVLVVACSLDTVLRLPGCRRQLARNSSSSASNCRSWAPTRPCGAPGWILSSPSLTRLIDFCAAACMGTIWSSSPCTIRVGTSTARRSSVRSVSEKALTQS